MRENSKFRTPSKEEVLAKENFKKAIAAKLESVVRRANECLADPKFIKYKEEFEAMRKDIFSKMREPMYPDPIQDAHYLRSCMNTILVLDILIDGPTKDKKNAVPQG